jgi:hypothetical protein
MERVNAPSRRSESRNLGSNSQSLAKEEATAGRKGATLADEDEGYTRSGEWAAIIYR